jgi:lactose/L-arabinose transport system permease protein
VSHRTSLRRAPAFILQAALLPLALLWLTPFWMMLVYSTAPDSELYNRATLLLPGAHFADNLRALLETTPFVTALLNSLGIAVITAALSVVPSCMAGYALARFRFYGARPLTGAIIAMLTVPYIVVIIPQFVMIARVFQLTNTWAGVILPTLCNASGVFLMRQNFLLLPQELFDCARVEGVGELAIFTRIAIPLVLPALATVSIISFLQAWNNYLWPLVMLAAPESWTAPVVLGSLLGSLDEVMWGAIMTGTLLMTVPMIFVFLLLQRYIVRGIGAAGRGK